MIKKEQKFLNSSLKSGEKEDDEGFSTYLYEVLKGTKPAALVTCEENLLGQMLPKLQKENLRYFIQSLPNSKVNIFFGAKECIEIVENFLNKPMCKFSPFEDFILGAILGYDIKLQCKRLLKRSDVNQENNSTAV